MRPRSASSSWPFVAGNLAFGNSHGAPIGAYSTNHSYSFVTAPSLHPPIIKTDQATVTGKLAPGYIFTANFYDLNNPPILGQSGPLILDNEPAAGLVSAGAGRASSRPT